MRDLIQALEPIAYEGNFTEKVDEIRREIESFEKAKKEAEDEARDLVIAIVGRVKSGKSSFLNALLFEGESILPQAATPMTAALTFIRYDEVCHAEVEFFTSEDWKNFKEKAANYEKEYQLARQVLEREEEDAEKKAKRHHRNYTKTEISDARVKDKVKQKLGEETFAAKELVQMAANLALNGNDHLGKKKRIEGSTPKELAEKLQDYVGAGGRYTPIVCSTTIYLNEPGLKGYCVIDTPGTNDPVISRGKKTQDNLKRADVVLVMSPAFRFYDNSDLSLCSQNLPANGIKDFLILISQFDVSIGEIEDTIDHSLPPVVRLREAMKKVRLDLIGRYHQCISKIHQQTLARPNAADTEKWERLLAETPILVSAKAFILAQHWDSMDSQEKEYLEKFDALIPGFKFNREYLQDFSMMGNVYNHLNEVKAKKGDILSKRKAELAAVARKRIGELLVEFRDFVKTKIVTLESSDIAKIKASLSAQKKRLERGRVGLEDIFEETIDSVHDKFNAILCEVREARSKYARVNVESETHQGVRTQYVNRGGFGIVDFFLGPKEVHQYYTYTTKYADTYQAVDQVEAFADKARGMLEKGIRESIDIKAVQRKIINVAYEILEGDEETEFDVARLRGQIRKAVREVSNSIPDPNFGDVNYAELITSYFSGSRVEEGQIEMLKSAQHEALQSVITDLERRVQEKATIIEQSLKHARETFVDDLLANLEKDYEELKAEFSEKEATCDRCRRCLSILEAQCKTFMPTP